MVQGREARRMVWMDILRQEIAVKEKAKEEASSQKALKDALEKDGDPSLAERLLHIELDQRLEALSLAIERNHLKNVKTIYENLNLPGTISTLKLDIKMVNSALNKGNCEIARLVLSLLLHSRNTEDEKQQMKSLFETKYVIQKSLFLFFTPFTELHKDVRGLIAGQLKAVCQTAEHLSGFVSKIV
ncbi:MULTISPECIES: hypothetical protein [Legionella]|uniref:hypothetical protein n=1 Tax=Legionella TaxID=445 RepID=UPI0009655B7C|nr:MULTISPECIES: hypothetical protein [Legionella]MBN9226685.1 hypothetical protein [Legionella steelei]OJW06758.1 MAG: hypothetical protein BGO44_18410 [Legionella sp. 39-23]